MKGKTVSSVLLLCLLFLAASGVPAFAAGKLKIEPMDKNFGLIDEGTDARMIATVTNVGDAGVTITNVRTN